jgi:tryptophan 7-halogenase
MTANPIRRLLIVGGGTAGWMMAAAAARFLADGQRSITLVESDAIGTVGVGEATIPPILGFNRLLGIDEAEFLRATGGSFKLGIEFVGWGTERGRYFHPFGTLGRSFEGLSFHQIWLKLREKAGVGDIADYSIAALAAAQGRFAPPVSDPRSPLSGLAYAYHFDAGRYAAFLRARAEAGGVTRVEGRIAAVEHDLIDGSVASVRLEDGRELAADLFVDCSGFRSLLLGEALSVPWEDWSHWLPCDRALAVPTARVDPLPPFTRSTARAAGWQWRIPLQHRTGNGYVYSSGFTDDCEAERLLLAHLDGAPLDAPRLLRFATGRRARQWEKNVVALGLAGGFLEPLESTSIHLIQEGIPKLMALFPGRPIAAVERDTYNRMMDAAYVGVRDFIILHYHLTQRRDSAFWRHVGSMDIPDTLQAKITLFREKGRLFRYDDELFSIPSWLAVMLGQGVMPEGYDPVVDALAEDRLLTAVLDTRRANLAAARAMPDHAQALAALAALPASRWPIAPR